MRKAKDVALGDLTNKDMSVIREGDSTRAQLTKSTATLRDYSMKHRVTMRWDMSEESQRDMMFELTIDDKTVILDWEEMLRNGRWV